MALPFFCVCHSQEMAAVYLQTRLLNLQKTACHIYFPLTMTTLIVDLDMPFLEYTDKTEDTMWSD